MKKYVTPEMEIVLFGDRTGMVFAESGPMGRNLSLHENDMVEVNGFNLIDALAGTNSASADGAGTGFGSDADASAETDTVDTPMLDPNLGVVGSSVSNSVLGSNDGTVADGVYDPEVVPGDYTGTGAAEETSPAASADDSTPNDGFGGEDVSTGF